MAKSNFDAVMEDNKKLANTAIPDGAMSYADYVTASGVDSAGDLEAAKKSAETGYLAAVESAERAHDRAIGTYGQNAEAMARAGLGGSGYSDYITGNAYAAKQGSIDAAKATRQASIDAAESTKKLTDAGTQKGYLDYIEKYKMQKKADSVSAIRDIVTMNLSGEGAKSYLEALGLGSESDKILGITGGILGKREEEEAKAKADAADANYGSAIEYAAGLINAGMSEKSIKDMLAKQYGYDAAYIDDVWAKASEYAEKVTKYNSAQTEDEKNNTPPKIPIDSETWIQYTDDLKFLEDLEGRNSSLPSYRIDKVAERFGLDISRLGELWNEAAKTDGTKARNEAYKALVLAELGNDPKAKAMLEGYDAYVTYVANSYAGTYSDADIRDLIIRLTGENEENEK